MTKRRRVQTLNLDLSTDAHERLWQTANNQRGVHGQVRKDDLRWLLMDHAKALAFLTNHHLQYSNPEDRQ